MSTVQCRSLEAILTKRRQCSTDLQPAKRPKRMTERQVAMVAFDQSRRWADDLEDSPPLEPALDLYELGKVAKEAERYGSSVVAIDLIELCRRRAEEQADRTAWDEHQAEQAERAEERAHKKKDDKKKKKPRRRGDASAPAHADIPSPR